MEDETSRADIVSRGARDRDTAMLVAALQGRDVEVNLLTREELPAAVSRTARSLLADYQSVDGLAIVVVATANNGIMRNLRSEAEGISEGIPVFPYWATKGREYFAGLVVDAVDYESADGPITFGSYKLLSGLYVAISRFRDCLSIATFSRSSPVWNIRTNGVVQ